MYDGALPTTFGYNPMHPEGALVLGVGGDAVQANVVATGYGR
jgi:hypothetical protein